MLKINGIDSDAGVSDTHEHDKALIIYANNLDDVKYYWMIKHPELDIRNSFILCTTPMNLRGELERLERAHKAKIIIFGNPFIFYQEFANTVKYVLDAGNYELCHFQFDEFIREKVIPAAAYSLAHKKRMMLQHPQSLRS